MIISNLILTAMPWLSITEHVAGVKQGILAGVIFLVGLFLVRVVPKKYQFLTAGILLVVVTPLAIGGFWFSAGPLGISDWDYYFSYHHVLRQTVLHYHVFPFWNPYTCGGTAGLGDPEFPLFTPTFLLELIFGIPNGMRLAIYLSTATLAVGMLRLAKRLGFNVWGALLTAIGVAFGTVNLLEIVEGHQNILTVMWIPWVLLAWYNAYQARKAPLNKWTVVTAIFLAFMFYGGGIYLLMYMAFAFIGLMLFSKNKLWAIKITALAGVISLGLAGLKLLPVFLWLREFQDQAYASSAYTLPYLHKILLGRYLHGADVIPLQGSGWHEYGGYIGPFVLVVAGLGVILGYRRRLTWALFMSTFLAILISSTGPFLKPFFDHTPWLPRSSITRVVLFAIIPISLLAGLGLNKITNARKWAWVVGVIILGVVAIDLMSLTYPLSEQAFVLPRVLSTPKPAPAPIAYSSFEYKTRYQGDDYTRAYEATLKGYGSLSYCAVLGPEPAVRTIHDEVDKDIISLASKNNANSGFQLLHWDPNRVLVEVKTATPTEVTLNANYAQGWYANGVPAKENAGRVSTNVSAGTTTVEFTYQTPGFTVGLLVSLITIISLIGYGIWYAKSPDCKKEF